MATYRFSMSIIKRSDGRSAIPAAAYRAGERLEDPRTGEVSDFSRRSGVMATGVLAPPEAPAWATNRQRLWGEVELAEKRRDAQVARAFEVALPHELSPGQREALLRGFLEAEFVARGMVADFAIHAPDRGSDPRNHHAHVMLTMRQIGPQGFGKKNREWNDDALCQHWREAWDAHCNRALEAAGVAARVDHRSLKAQRAAALEAGDVAAASLLDRAPEPRIGWRATAVDRRLDEAVEAGAIAPAQAEKQRPRAAVLVRMMRQMREELAEVWAEISELAQAAVQPWRPKPPGPRGPGL